MPPVLQRKVPDAPAPPPIFDRFADAVTAFAGSSRAFTVAIVLVVIWLCSGPLFHFSDTWQLVMNTTAAVITFLMVFLIQKTQNKNARALHLKLNELIGSSPRASNRLVAVEDLTEEELNLLRKFYQRLNDLADASDDIHRSHSIDRADQTAAERQQSIRQSDPMAHTVPPDKAGPAGHSIVRSKGSRA